jgi:hypothetical protein
MRYLDKVGALKPDVRAHEVQSEWQEKEERGRRRRRRRRSLCMEEEEVSPVSCLARDHLHPHA